MFGYSVQKTKAGPLKNNSRLLYGGTFPHAGASDWNETKIKMAVRRVRRDFRVVAVHQSGAHESAGRERFGRHQRAAAGNHLSAACRLLRLPLTRNQM